MTLAPVPKNSTRRMRIFLVDDHPIVRRGLADLINAEPDLKVCGESDSAESALAAVPGAEPDVVIADITLPGADGIELIRFLRKAKVKAPVLILTMHEEDEYAERAIRAGANGFIMKYRAMQDLLGAIRCVLSGRLYLSTETSERLLNQTLGKKSGGIEGLSARELQVLELLGAGEGTRAVALKLRLSVKTVETYRAKIKEKLHLTGAAQLVRTAVQWVERKAEGSHRRAKRRTSSAT
jgi:DNA-binding NarL/FixJ family response regulator